MDSSGQIETDLFIMDYVDQNKEERQAKASAMPNMVTIMEVGPRDGLQFEKKMVLNCECACGMLIIILTIS